MKFAVKDVDGNYVINAAGERIMFPFKAEAKIHRDSLQREAYPELEIGPSGKNLMFFVTRVDDAPSA